ncbi:MAG: RnfABCDGE type electron transport complex subunit B [Calditrichaceae bacterium]|nr:RnfABCDGE type electron transport complex subunit B [Calditrichaceae bacterium]MBN2709635.1 RnfABCDGE type electron transport complex subunit B [Calditrichaceae bacterium]RQV92430.1 MAG: RnfABCDGE type electron transport complex subunit B [Calditrichota bacterium]
MLEIIIPGLILGGFALISASGLLVASKKFYVFEDPRIAEVNEMLPGANCGGCGFAGCLAFAEHLVKNEDTDAICPVASGEEMQKILAFLGREAAVGEKMVASLMCNGTHDNCKSQMDYAGIEDCWAATLVTDSTKACSFACIGLGSCVKACNFDAMHIENGIVVIDDEKCTGCGLCVPACPKNLLHMRPYKKYITVACYNTDRGADARKACTVACIGCLKCEKACNYDAIHVNNFLAKIDYQKCTNCGDCVTVCPTNSIIIRGQEVHVAVENV